MLLWFFLFFVGKGRKKNKFVWIFYLIVYFILDAIFELICLDQMVLQNSFFYENLGLQKAVSLKGVESKYVLWSLVW